MKNRSLRRFGQNVRRLRMEKGLSQESLAAAAECHRNYIGGVERGERNLSVQKIIRIALALNCDISELFDGLNPKDVS